MKGQGGEMSDEQEVPYVVVEKRGSGVGSFLLGVICGAAAGLLFAPRSGEETQRELRERALHLRDDAEEKLEELRGELSEVYERAREDVADRVDRARDEIRERRRRAEQFVQTGRSAAQSARSDLEKRVAESKRAYKEAVSESGPEAEEVSEDVEETETAETEA